MSELECKCEKVERKSFLLIPSTLEEVFFLTFFDLNSFHVRVKMTKISFLLKFSTIKKREREVLILSEKEKSFFPLGIHIHPAHSIWLMIFSEILSKETFVASSLTKY